MREAHQGVPIAGLPLGDWRGEDAQEPPTSPQPAPVASAGAPLAINKIGEAMSNASVGRGGRPPIPPAPIPQAPAPRERNILEKLLGQL